jgi:thymidylate kinase
MNLTRFEKLDRSFYERLVHGFESIYKGREDVIRLDALSDEQSLAQTAFNELNKRLLDTGLLLS